MIKLLHKFENLKELSIEITGRCMNKCIFCSGSCSKNTNEFLSIDTIRNILIQINNIDLETIYISGGEPFLHPDIIDILSMIRCMMGKTRIVIYTSGVIKTPFGIAGSISKNMFNKCEEYIDEISFDIPSLNKDQYRKMCGRNINIVLKSLENAKKCYESNSNILISRNVVLTKINMYEVMRRGIHTNYMKLVNQGRAKNNINILRLDDKDDSFIKKALSKNTTDKIGNPYKNKCICTAGITKMIITYEGKVYPCDSMKCIKFDTDFNDISLYTLREIYDSEYFKYIRNIVTKNNSTPYEFGDNKCIRNMLYDKN